MEYLYRQITTQDFTASERKIRDMMLMGTAMVVTYSFSSAQDRLEVSDSNGVLLDLFPSRVNLQLDKPHGGVYLPVHHLIVDMRLHTKLPISITDCPFATIICRGKASLESNFGENISENRILASRRSRCGAYCNCILLSIAAD